MSLDTVSDAQMGAQKQSWSTPGLSLRATKGKFWHVKDDGAGVPTKLRVNGNGRSKKRSGERL